MNRLYRPLRSTLFALPFILGISAPGCFDDLTGATELQISDANQGCSTSTPNAPYALGSKLDLNVTVDGKEADIVDSSLGQPGIWTFKEPRTTDVSLTLQAQGVGKTVLTVRDSLGLTGVQELEVSAIAEAEIAPWKNMQPFNLTVDLTAGHIAPIVLTPAGIGLLPNTPLRMQVTLSDAIGRALRGYDVADWKVAPTNGLELTPAEPGIDDVIVEHDGSQTGPVTLSTVGNGLFTVERSPAGATDELQVFHVEAGKRGTTLSVAEGAVATVVVLAYDDTGRLLFGDDGDRLMVSLTNDGVSSVVAPPWSEGEDGIALDPEMEALLLDARTFYLRGLAQGTTTITVNVAGHQIDVPVTVTPPAPLQ